MSTKPVIEYNDLKTIIKLGNRLSEEHIKTILTELKNGPSLFTADMDISLYDSLMKFIDIYGDESFFKVKFIIDKYDKFEKEKQFETRMKITDSLSPGKLLITQNTVIKKDGAIIGFDEVKALVGEEFDVKFIFNPVFKFIDGIKISMDVREVILTSVGSDKLDGNDIVDLDDPGTTLSVEI